MTHSEGTVETGRLSVTLVDDNRTYRSALRTMISDYPQIGTVREAANADELFDMLGDSPPDVVIMDVSMPGMDGFEATERLYYQHPHIKVIILTIYNTEEYQTKAKQCGAVAFVAKQDAVEGLEVALKAIFHQNNATS